MVRAGGFEPL